MIKKSLLAVLFVGSAFAGCNDSALIDTNQAVPGRNWSYAEKVRIPVTVTDSTKRYNLYFNLRHTANYKYSNIFVLIHETGPDRKRKTRRKEFQLAYPDGEWLGSGSGNIYSYSILFNEGHKFDQKGTYVFELEQNMRDNPLREISDVGLRVEPVSN